MSPRSPVPRHIDGRGRSSRPHRRAWPAVLPLVLVLASCTSVVAGTPQTMAGAVVERPLTPSQQLELSDAVVAAHAALSSMTRTTEHSDPISTDVFRIVETRVADRVDRTVTFTPTTVAVWSLDEIRCVDRRAYATPPPEGLEVDRPWVEVPIDPAEGGPDSGGFITYYCDYGYAEDLAYDVTFLAEAAEIVDLGAEEVQGVPVRRYRVELDTLDSAGALVGMSWVYDDTLATDVAGTTTVDITIDDRDRIRTLDSSVVADGDEYGDNVVFGGFDENVDVAAPDPDEVATG